MAEFPVDFQNLKESFSSDINIINNINDKFDHSLPSIEQICSSNNLQPFSLHHQPFNFLNHGIPSSSSILPTNNIHVYDHLAHIYSSSGREQIHEDTNANKKPESDFLPINQNLSPSGSDLGRGKNSNNGSNEHYNSKKRKRNNCNKELEKPARDVVHVRAKRGQATDSHSLAERVRREKINEKLRSLQDLVPGCYKTMGMAVMLDVIINYVRSLQNQIDFLSMKLSAASLYCDFNSPEIDGMLPTLQGSNNPYDANQSQRMVGEGYAGFIPHVQTSWPL